MKNKRNKKEKFSVEDFDMMSTDEVLNVFIKNDKVGCYVTNHVFNELISSAPNHVLNDAVGKFITYDTLILNDWMDNDLNPMVTSMMGSICREIKSRIVDDMHKFDL